MIISKLLLWLYCLDITDMLLLLIVCTFIFCLAKKHYSKFRWWKVLVSFLLLITFVAVLYTTLGTRTGGENWQINLIPLHSYREVINGGNIEILRSNFMNAVLFYPIGLFLTALLPETWPNWIRCILIVLFSATLSIGIEYIQYMYVLGRCEIDDVIHNVVGALVGNLTMSLMSKLYERSRTLVKQGDTL